MPDNSDAIPAAKAKLRERFKEFRRSLQAEEYERLSTQVIERVRLLPEIRNAHVVHQYWPMVDHREPDTRPLIHWFEERGATVVLPKVVRFDRDANSVGRLRHFRYPGARELVVNKWGISEPSDGEDVDTSTLDVVIVPALGAGRNGHRIGHGLGFYDEFLASTAAIKIGLVYDECFVDYVPHEAHDVPLDIIISETSAFRPPFV